MSTTPTIITERLEALDALTIQRGAHGSIESAGAITGCSMELAAWIAGEPHSDHPQCVSPVLTSYMIRLNDRWSEEKRQTLKPYLSRLIGTAGDGQDAARLKLARTFLLVDALPAWLVLAGMDAEAEQVKGWATKEGLGRYELRDRLYEVRSKTWAKRSEWRKQVRAKVRELLKDKPVAAAAADAVAAAAADADAVAAAAADAVAVAAAVADAVAAAVADAVAVAAAAADADAVAAAVADAVAVAAAAADAAADADADADAVADAVAAAVADADAVADAVAAAVGGSNYSTAYKAAKTAWTEHLETSTDPKMVAVRELAASHDRLALDLLERMIDPSAAVSA